MIHGGVNEEQELLHHVLSLIHVLQLEYVEQQMEQTSSAIQQVVIVQTLPCLLLIVMLMEMMETSTGHVEEYDEVLWLVVLKYNILFLEHLGITDLVLLLVT